MSSPSHSLWGFEVEEELPFHSCIVTVIMTVGGQDAQWPRGPGSPLQRAGVWEMHKWNTGEVQLLPHGDAGSPEQGRRGWEYH